jgi:hypothetical protein
MGRLKVYRALAAPFRVARLTFNKKEPAVSSYRPEGHYTNCIADKEDFISHITGIKRHGVRSLTFRNMPANPEWIKPKWRKKSGVKCPRCKLEIVACLHNHHIEPGIFCGAPHIFCNCIRLSPSRLPNLQFFTDNWDIVLHAVDYAKATAIRRVQS